MTHRQAQSERIPPFLFCSTPTDHSIIHSTSREKKKKCHDPNLVLIPFRTCAPLRSPLCLFTDVVLVDAVNTSLHTTAERLAGVGSNTLALHHYSPIFEGNVRARMALEINRHRSLPFLVRVSKLLFTFTGFFANSIADFAGINQLPSIPHPTPTPNNTLPLKKKKSFRFAYFDLPP